MSIGAGKRARIQQSPRLKWVRLFICKLSPKAIAAVELEPKSPRMKDTHVELRREGSLIAVERDEHIRHMDEEFYDTSL